MIESERVATQQKTSVNYVPVHYVCYLRGRILLPMARSPTILHQQTSSLTSSWNYQKFTIQSRTLAEFSSADSKTHDFLAQGPSMSIDGRDIYAMLPGRKPGNVGLGFWL